jgi:hypothetical protein
MTDPVQLAKDMLAWREKRTELDVIEDRIREAVLELGKTQTVGDVKASYSAGRRTFGYQQAVQDYMAQKPEMMQALIADVESQTRTVTTTTVDYKTLCGRWKLEAPVVAQSEPSVSIKFV